MIRSKMQGNAKLQSEELSTGRKDAMKMPSIFDS
jgi:hypothetical protein